LPDSTRAIQLELGEASEILSSDLGTFAQEHPSLGWLDAFRPNVPPSIAAILWQYGTLALPRCAMVIPWIAMERDRYQIVVALGEGADGKRVKALLSKAAERAGQSPSTWARERLLVAAGIRSEDPLDPLVEIRIGENNVTTLDLRAVSAMQVGWTHQVNALLNGQWVALGTQAPDELFNRWKQIRRASAS
jgi:hypothetical protein